MVQGHRPDNINVVASVRYRTADSECDRTSTRGPYIEGRVGAACVDFWFADLASTLVIDIAG